MKKLLLFFGLLLTSLVIADSVSAASLEVVYPSGGERLKGGETYEFRLNQVGLKSVRIRLENSEGYTMTGTSASIDIDSDASQVSYQYTVPNRPDLEGDNEYKVDLTGYKLDSSEPGGNPSAQSDGYFSIYRDLPDLVITDLQVKQSVGWLINWSSEPLVSNNRLYFDIVTANEANPIGNYSSKIRIEVGGMVCEREYSTSVLSEYTTSCSSSDLKLSPGTYQAIATIDPENNVAEVDENNNTQTMTLEIIDANEYVWPINECQSIYPLPEGHYHETCLDIFIEDIELSSASPKVNEEITIAVKGVTDFTGGPVTLGDLDRYDNNFQDFITTNIAITEELINPGGPFEYLFTGHFTSIGQKELHFQYDPLNRKNEASESNNEYTEVVSVVASSNGDIGDADGDDEATDDDEPTECIGGTGDGQLECMDDSDDDTPPVPTLYVDQNLTNRLKGKILLQVEEHGEAWYVRPDDGKRMYMADGDAAYGMMRNLGLGITNADLAKIPIGFEDRFECLDTDGDGLCNKLEDGLGTDKYKADSDGDGFDDGTEIRSDYQPLGPDKLSYDNNLINRLKGKILLQVEAHGEAWYINPDDGKRYYMPDGPSAYQIMRFLSLGITNSDLAKIDT
ncbi:hypothetical protein HOB10_04615 [Candidatus Parcubacteria bacterium]|jgi:hypothetical protein|nr:hypothetical protein [Candidatus Parcubacteria bacterium]